MLTSWLPNDSSGRKNLLNILVEKKVNWFIRKIVIPVDKIVQNFAKMNRYKKNRLNNENTKIIFLIKIHFSIYKSLLCVDFIFVLLVYIINISHRIFLKNYLPSLLKLWSRYVYMIVKM